MTHADRGPASESDEVVALAQRLIRQPSENPPGATVAVCEVLEAALGPAGFALERVESAPGAASLLASFDFGEPGPTLMLNGHIDVVPVGGDGSGWTRDPWGGELHDGRLYGRGSVDMKGAVAAMAVAARAAVRSGAGLTGRIVVAAVADEEQGGRLGSGALVAGGHAVADAVIVGEPSAGRVVVAHRGACFVELTTHGRSGHASMPDHSRSAVELMVDVLQACRDIRLTHDAHDVLGSPSIAVGTTIQGGDKVNVIPDRCRATLDVRTVPGMSADSVVADLVEALRRGGFRIPEELELRVTTDVQPAQVDPAARIVEVACEAMAEQFGRPAELGGMPAATDAWWFANRAGIPTVAALGPGSIADCHVVDESVSVAELVAFSALYRRIIDKFLGSGA